jgi:hypothetical protein
VVNESVWAIRSGAARRADRKSLALAIATASLKPVEFLVALQRNAHPAKTMVDIRESERDQTLPVSARQRKAIL